MPFFSSSEEKQEHNNKLTTQSKGNKTTMHCKERSENKIDLKSVNLLIPLDKYVEKKECEYLVLNIFKTEILETVSMMYAQCIYIPESTLYSACQLETIVEIEEEMDISSSIGNYNCIASMMKLHTKKEILPFLIGGPSIPGVFGRPRILIFQIKRSIYLESSQTQETLPGQSLDEYLLLS